MLWLLVILQLGDLSFYWFHVALSERLLSLRVHVASSFSKYSRQFYLLTLHRQGGLGWLRKTQVKCPPAKEPRCLPIQVLHSAH
ncbi:hypothetical protein F5Y01DRAFT_279767 [Xylaria sp. FL0043]|nr:hypothetical protein F5Y01DRAFT_279767 [Xylaria sp. FL0043]